jgi:hypothetical protein
MEIFDLASHELYSFDSAFNGFKVVNSLFKLKATPPDSLIDISVEDPS